MKQSDLKRLAEQFMGNAVAVKPKDNVWIEYQGPKALKLAKQCAEVVKSLKASPYLIDSSSKYLNQFIAKLTDEELEKLGQKQLEMMKTMDGYIRVRDDYDQAKSKLSADRMTKYRKAVRPMTEYRVNNTRWLVTQMPTKEFAKECGMSKSTFDKFYKDVCLLNYKTMEVAAKPLEDLMRNGKKVRIIGKDTDLSFSIKGINAVACTGEHNIPDGECFTAPVKDSVNGTIRFGKSNYDGESFKTIKLEIQKGKIIKAIAENEERTKALNAILDRDEKARYFGEFAIAFNPFVKTPMGSILFDEKIDGSLHLAAGNCYDVAPNGNKSSVHWDMVHIQRPEYGGGEIWIDDVLIRKDGIFVLPELKGLNPENLMKASQSKLTTRTLKR